VDVAYRLCPEVDVQGMVGDAKRAIAWIKENAGHYGIDPARVVLGGASAGGHIALLAAYAPNHPDLRPADVGDADLSVRAVFAYYAQSDMRAVADQFPDLPQASAGGRAGAPVPPPPGKRGREWLRYQAAQLERSANTLADLLGGSPAEVPQIYDLASPIHHAGAGSPPTLLVHGEHDMLVPVGPTRALHRKLLDAGVPVVYLELPQTEHAFDLLLPRTSPPAQAALYDLERFLALMV
jgi:acetyl esterase/lipase